jgi:hypothetical protein
VVAHLLHQPNRQRIRRAGGGARQRPRRLHGPLQRVVAPTRYTVRLYDPVWPYPPYRYQ